MLEDEYNTRQDSVTFLMPNSNIFETNIIVDATIARVTGKLPLCRLQSLGDLVIFPTKQLLQQMNINWLRPLNLGHSTSRPRDNLEDLRHP